MNAALNKIYPKNITYLYLKRLRHFIRLFPPQMLFAFDYGFAICIPWYQLVFMGKTRRKSRLWHLDDQRHESEHLDDQRRELGHLDDQRQESEHLDDQRREL